jgi:Na+-driven multidrug efflux pump
MVHLLLARLVTPFGTSALAAYGITRNLEQFTALGSMGLGRASGTLVGQNLGANNPERAKRTVRWALGYVTAIRGSMALMLMAFPALFVAIFSSDPALMEVAVVWVRIQAVTGLVMGGSMVFSQSFNVAGDTMAPMIITMIAMVGVELPLAFALSQWTPMGQYGIPLAITIAMILRIAIYFPYFLKGRWLRIKVID